MKIRIGNGKYDMARLCDVSDGEMTVIPFGDVNGDIAFEEVCTDSREAGRKTLFIAMRGERADGHDYIDGALANGCKCVLCEKVPEKLQFCDFAAVEVEDSVKAIGNVAKDYWENNPHITVGVTGSVGKTSTKELIASVLSEKYRVHKTEGNYNSEIGLPLTMLSYSSDQRYSVLEMGMSARGEISRMSHLTAPDIAVITNVGSSHLEKLGSREEILEAKLEICDGMSEEGILIINSDNDMLSSDRMTRVKQKKIKIAIYDEDADYRAENIVISDGYTTFDVAENGKRIKALRMPVIGEHYVYAGLAAYVVGKIAGLGEKRIRNGFEKFTLPGMRQKIYGLRGRTLIEDCYNACPDSMKAALCVLEKLGDEMTSGKKIAVLGDMLELGEDSGKMHEDVGNFLVTKGVDILICVGKEAGYIAKGAKSSGMDAKRIYEFPDTEKYVEIADFILKTSKKNDIILFKASRSVKEERIIEALKAKNKTSPEDERQKI